MSPKRIVIYEDCPHAECEEYTSVSRGWVTRTIVCRHPENADCVCVRSVDPDAECVLCGQKVEACPET